MKPAPNMTSSTALTSSGSNPFEAFGAAATGNRPNFPYMKFSKGDFLTGKDAEVIPLGSEYIVLPKTLTTGYIGWENGAPTDRIMGRVAEGSVPPRLAELPQRDKSTWEMDDRGEPRDPYQLTNEVVLVSRKDPTKAYTFTTSSRGGLSAIGEVAKAYGTHMRSHPTEAPVARLDVNSYQHSNRAFGRIKTPKFAIVAWVEEGPFLQVLDAAGSGSTSQHTNGGGGHDDDWDAPF